MKNDEFTHYYGKHKPRKFSVTQKDVATNKSIIKKFRVDQELDRMIENKCHEKNKKFSELNRILWLAYFEVEKNIAWKKEIEEWDKRPKIFRINKAVNL